jgi:hypothetical protein
MIAALLAVAIQFAAADNAPQVSGSYVVTQRRAVGSQVQIGMRIHLTNHGTSDLSIRRLTLWDFSHPEKGGSRVSALTLRAHAAADTTQQFTVSRSDYQSWQKGFRPRFVLETAGTRSTPGSPVLKRTLIVRLDHTSGQEGK